MFAVLIHVALSTALLTDPKNLRFCRELSYSYVVSQDAINEFGVATEFGIDQQLVARYDDLSRQPVGSLQCLFHWKNLMCSHVFRTSQNAAACDILCEAAGSACSAQKPLFCAASSASACTDYGALTGFCAPSAEIVNSSPTPPGLPAVQSDAAVAITLSVALTTIILTTLHFWLQL
jgi:hypothetical protein